MPAGAAPLDRILVHLKNSRRVVIEPHDVYYLEASGDETVIRRRGRQTLRDVRSLGQVMPAFEQYHFHRIHDGWAVNLRRVREIRPQHDGRDWEVVMLPPVNTLVPISRRRLPGLLRRFSS